MSQERLGEALGLTFQQVQKYERGVNRVGASRLFDLSRVMDVPISFFFDDLPEATSPSIASHNVKKTVGAFASGDNLNDDTMHRRETLELVRSYYRIGDAGIRKKIVELMKSLSITEPK